jgi:hypothetical protein
MLLLQASIIRAFYKTAEGLEDSMSRIVKRSGGGAAAAGARPAAPTGATGNDDDYPSRVAKYIPGEVVGAYLAILKVLESVVPEAPGANIVGIVAWVAFFICLFVGVPGYLRAIAQRGDPWLYQAVISMGAFVFWAYALGGPFQMAGIYVPWLSSILLILYTLVAGIFQPE